MRSRLTPGDLALCDTSRPDSFTYESRFSTVLVLVPRSLIPLRPETLRVVTGQRMAADKGVGAVVAPFVRSLTEQSAHCSGPEVSRPADEAVSLVTALLYERLGRTTRREGGPCVLWCRRPKRPAPCRLRPPGQSPPRGAALGLALWRSRAT